MKRNIFYLVVGLILTCTLNQSCSNSDAAVPKVKSTPNKVDVVTDLSLVENLAKIGFSKSSSVVSIQAATEKATWAKLGFTYFSEKEITYIMEENNFYIAPASNFIGTIESEAAKKITSTYTSLESSLEEYFKIYIAPDGRWFSKREVNAFPKADADWILSGKKFAPDVFVIAPIEKFDKTNMVLDGRELKPQNPDPIAVAKLTFGYIELARW